MASPTVPVYRLPFSSDGLSFGALDILARLEDQGVPVPLAMAGGRCPTNWLMFSTPDFVLGNTSATVRAELNPNAPLASLPDDPVPCEILLAAQQAADGTLFSGASEVLKPCQISVSAVRIDWDVEPAEFKRDGKIWIPADGITQCQLILRARRLVPGQGVMDDDTTIEFTHMVQPGSFPAPIAPVFGIDREPVQGSREDRTPWRSKLLLPDASRPDIIFPADCAIRVRAWSPAGKITRHGFSSISVNGAKRKDQIFVPVVFAEPKLKIEVLEPAMPIPANATPVTVKLAVQWEDTSPGAKEGAGRPAANTGIEWVSKPGQHPAFDSKCSINSGKTDAEGNISFDYTPPNLFYFPKGRFHEDFEVFSGQGPKRVKIGEFRLLLAPGLKVKIAALKEKKVGEVLLGIKLEESVLERSATEFVKSLSGRVQIKAVNPETTQQKTFGVAWADLAIEAWDGARFVKVDGPKPGEPWQTTTEGKFTLAMPEVASHYTGENRQKGEDIVIDDTLLPDAELNDASEAEAKNYETQVVRRCPFEILTADLTAKLKGYRVNFVENLAQQETKVYDVVLAAIRLLRSAANYSQLFHEIYKAQTGRVWDDIKNFAVELVGLLWNMSDISGKVVGLFASLAKSIADGVTKRLIPYLIGKGFNRVIGLCRSIVDLMDRLGSWILSQFPAMGRAWESAKARFLQFLNEWGTTGGWDINAIGRFLGNLIAVIVRGLGTIASMCFYAFMALARGFFESVRNLFVRMSPSAVQRFQEAVQEALSNVYFVALGTALEKAFDAICSYFAGLFWSESVEPVVDGRTTNHPWLDKINVYKKLCEPTLQFNFNQSRIPDSPVDFETRHEELSDYGKNLNALAHTVSSFNTNLDFLKDLADLAVTLVQVGIVFVSCCLVPGFAPHIAANISHLETAYRAFKTVYINLPQTCANAGFAVGYSLGSNFALFQLQAR